jgi:hypothetical protein
MAETGSGQSASGVALVAFLSVLIGLGGAVSLGWIAYLQVFTVPVIALFGVWIAARQMLIADSKLRLDSFIHQYDRRVAVYEATRAILMQVYHGGISQADVRDYGLRALDAAFLFDDDTAKYLRDLQHHIAVLLYAKSRIENATLEEDKKQYQAMAKDQMDWLREQGDEGTGLRTRFEQFLKYAAPTRPWLLRWP